MNVSLERPIHVARLSGPRLTHPRWEKRPMFPRRWDDKSDKWLSAWYGSQDTGGEASGCVDFDYSFFAGSFFLSSLPSGFSFFSSPSKLFSFTAAGHPSIPHRNTHKRCLQDKP